jgi:DNA-binding Xre family transcriptional regulator
MNISQLSRKSALAYSTVHALWHDSAQVWNRHSLDRIARAMNVRVADLFDGEPEKEEGA